MQHDRYADNGAYDEALELTVIVVEVKQDEHTPSESQNNEQMVALWKPKQQAMLGLELNAARVKPKILLLQGKKMMMIDLQELEMAEGSSLQELIKLVAAFLICVK